MTPSSQGGAAALARPGLAALHLRCEVQCPPRLSQIVKMYVPFGFPGGFRTEGAGQGSPGLARGASAALGREGSRTICRTLKACGPAPCLHQEDQCMVRMVRSDFTGGKPPVAPRRMCKNRWTTSCHAHDLRRKTCRMTMVTSGGVTAITAPRKATNCKTSIVSLSGVQNLDVLIPQSA